MAYTIEIDDTLEDWEWADAKDELVLAFEALGDLLEVEGNNIGWTRDRKVIAVESHNAWRFLSINGEYRLVAEVDEDVITVVRYSHDEPVGASFKFTKAKEIANV